MSAPTSGNLTQWRDYPQYTELYVYIHVPEVVFKRRINQATPFIYPVELLPYDNPDSNPGTDADAKYGYTINVYDSAGNLKGNLRCKGATSLMISIAPTGQGDIDFQDNDILEVVKGRRIWVEVPHLLPDGTSYKDFSDSFPVAAQRQPPVANAGPDIADEVDAVTGLLTVEFDAANSFPVAEGATLTDYLWDVDGGTIILGAADDPQISVTFPGGAAYDVSLTVTDSNGGIHTAYVLVAALNDDLPAFPCRRARLGGDIDSGWEASFELLGGNLAAIPFGAKVILYTREKYGTATGAINGYPGREQIYFVGWITRDVMNPKVMLGTRLSINAQNTQALMAFSQTTTRIASPTNWFEMAHLNWFRHLIYLIRWHTNLDDLMDIERPSYYANYPAQRLDAQPGTIDDQINFLAQAVRARWTCDHQGRLYLRRNPHQMTDAEQAALTTIVTLTAADWTEDGPTFDTVHRDEVGWVRARGVLASASVLAEYEVVAPGKIPRGEGAAQATLNSQLVEDLDDLLYRASRLYKYRNLRLRRMTIPVHQQGLMVDPAWQEWVGATVDPASNERGIGFTNKKFLPKSVTLSFNENGAVDQSWQLENTPGTGIVRGVFVPAPGQAVPEDTDYLPNDGPLSEQSPLPWDFVAPIPYVPEAVSTSAPITSGLAIAWNSAKVVLSSDVSVAEPDWEDVFTPSGANTVVDVALAGDYKVYVLTTNGLYYSADITTTAPTLQSALTGGLAVRAVPGVANGVAVIGYEDDQLYDFDFTADDGDWFTVVGFADMTPSALTGIYDPGDGWRKSGIDPGGGGVDVCYIAFDMGAAVYLTRIVGTFTASGPDDANDAAGIWSRLNASLQDFDNALANVGATFDTGTVTAAAERYLFFAVANDYAAGTMAITSFQAYGYKTRVWYSTNNGTTFPTETEIAGYADDRGIDPDHHNAGVLLAAAAAKVWCTTAYTGAFIEVTGLGLEPGDPITSIRVPYATQAGANNSNASALQFFVTTASGKILLATLNASTGAATVSDRENPDWYVIGAAEGANGNALETFGGNPARIAAAMKPDGGGATHLFTSLNGGGNWIDRGEYDIYRPIYVESGQNGDGTQFLVSGVQGIGYATASGASIAAKTGDLSAETGSSTADGAAIL